MRRRRIGGSSFAGSSVGRFNETVVGTPPTDPEFSPPASGGSATASVRKSGDLRVDFEAGYYLTGKLAADGSVTFGQFFFPSTAASGNTGPVALTAFNVSFVHNNDQFELSSVISPYPFSATTAGYTGTFNK